MTDPFFAAAIAFTLGAEGGWFDDPIAGPTNLGLTLADMRQWLGHTAMVSDVRNLTPATATPIYRALYWLPVAGHELPGLRRPGRRQR